MEKGPLGQIETWFLLDRKFSQRFWKFFSAINNLPSSLSCPVVLFFASFVSLYFKIFLPWKYDLRHRENKEKHSASFGN